jgi:NAD(P) transhydrogenase subunit beta
VIAFLKLNGNMSGKPILLPARHLINLATLAGILRADLTVTDQLVAMGVLHHAALSYLISSLLIIPIRQGRHATVVVFDAEQLFRAWAAATWASPSITAR